MILLTANIYLDMFEYNMAAFLYNEAKISCDMT